MPWFTIIMALLSFFSAKAAGASDTKALLTAGLVGASSYYVTHETEWGRANLGDLDGVSVLEGDSALDPLTGNPILNTGGGAIKVLTNGTADVLKSWGATGTAKVVATGAAAAGGIFSSDNLPWLIAAGALLVVLR